jgi:uncharacterized protein (TIGR03643 family)
MPKALPKALSKDEFSRLIEMAWEDRTPFEAIEATFGFAEPQVIQLIRRELKRSSFNLWRERVSGGVTKHVALRSKLVQRAYCSTQYKNK